MHQIAPAGSKVALCTDAQLPVIRLHSEKLMHRVTYYGLKGNIDRFMCQLRKDKLLISCGEINLDSPSSNSGQDSVDTVEEQYLNTKEIDGSSTSPIKSHPDVLEDSGIDMFDVSQSQKVVPRSLSLNCNAATSSARGRYNGFDFNQEIEDLASGII